MTPTISYTKKMGFVMSITPSESCISFTDNSNSATLTLTTSNWISSTSATMGTPGPADGASP